MNKSRMAGLARAGLVVMIAGVLGPRQGAAGNQDQPLKPSSTLFAQNPTGGE